MNLEFIFTYHCLQKMHIHITFDKYSHFVQIPTLHTDNSGIDLRKVRILTLSAKLLAGQFPNCLDSHFTQNIYITIFHFKVIRLSLYLKMFHCVAKILKLDFRNNIDFRLFTIFRNYKR